MPAKQKKNSGQFRGRAHKANAGYARASISNEDPHPPRGPSAKRLRKPLLYPLSYGGSGPEGSALSFVEVPSLKLSVLRLTGTLLDRALFRPYDRVLTFVSRTLADYLASVVNGNRRTVIGAGGRLESNHSLVLRPHERTETSVWGVALTMRVSKL